MKRLWWLKKYICAGGVALGLAFLSGCAGETAQEQFPVLAQPESMEAKESAVILEKQEEVTVDLEESKEAAEDILPESEEDPGPVVRTFTISAAGDCSLGNYYGQDFNRSFRQFYEKEQNPGYFFENVLDIFSADDMTIVNLEGVLTYSDQLAGGRTYNIKGDPEYAGILTAGNVEAVSMANNHRLDYGEGGTKDTVEALEKEGIVYAYDEFTGMYENDGIKVGIVSVNAIHSNGVIEGYLKNGIEKLREEGADLVFACCHWGIEKDHFPNESQRSVGQKCIDWGADLVIGHHPHVLQGIEEYQGKYIIYSLGNFSFGANRNPSDKDTMIFQQTFTFVDGVKEEDTVAKIIPCCLSSTKEYNNYQPTPSVGDEAAKIIKRVNDFSKSFGVYAEEDGTLVSTEQ